jgi:hypothetical protein
LILFVEPHYDDFVLSAGMYSFHNTVDKVVTVFRSKSNFEGSGALCKDLNKEYEELGFPNINWKNPTLLFKEKDLLNALDPLFSDATLILTVLGVGNYAHNFLSQFIIEHYSNRHSILFFRDFPHSYDLVKLNYIPFNQHIKSFELVETLGNVDDYNKKLSLFRKYYPSQKSLLWFEREQFFHPVKEEIYKYNPSNFLW